MRLAGKLSATVIVLLLLCLTIVLALLHTRYATSIVTYALNTFSPYSVTANAVSYHITDPWHLTASDIHFKDQHQKSENLNAKVLQLWFSPGKLLKPGWHFDTILIDGLSLSANTEQPSLPELYTDRLALTNFDWHSAQLSLENSKLQLDNWQNRPDSGQTFSGDFQLAADQLAWQGIKLNEVLLDGDYKPNSDTQPQWTLYGFSFDWQQASFNGQAEYIEQDDALILNQLTVSDLKLHHSESLNSQWLEQQTRSLQLPQTIEIRRLDILDSSFEQPQLSLNHANLSLQNWHWPADHWHQQDARFSLSADSLRWHDTVMDAPLAELAFSPEQIVIEGASAKALEGYVQTDGTLTPDTLALNQLTLNSIKWFLPENWPELIKKTSQHFDNIQLAALDIGYAQVTDTTPGRHFQFSDLNVSGHDLLLKHEGQAGLWQGELTASSGFASIKTVSMVEPIITMRSQEGQWQLSELIVPFKNSGLLSANGKINLQQEGQPWQLELTTDSMPVSVLPQWLNLPLPLGGNMDIELAANGLGQHATSLAYSLEGELKGQFRQLQLSQQKTKQIWQQWSGSSTEQHSGKDTMSKTDIEETKPFSVSANQLHVQAERGKIKLAPISLQSRGFTATLQGNWDLAKPNGKQVKLQATQGCLQLEKEWRGNQKQVLQSSSCDGNNIKVPVKTDAS